MEDQDVYYEQKRKEFIGVLNYLFIDCSGMSETIMKTEFKETDLVGIVRRYNECTGSGYKVFKEEKKSFELSYYVNAGIGFSTLKFRNDLYGLISQDVAEMKSKAPAFGVGLLVTDPLVVENLYASVEFQYSRAAFEGSYIKRTELYDYYENFSIRYSRLKFPLALSYNLSPNPSSLYLKLGLCFNFFFSGKLDARQRKEFNLGDEVIFYEDKSDMDGFRIIQFWAGLGYQLQINNKFKSYIEIRGEAIGGEGNSGVRTDQYALIIDPKSVKSNTWSVLVGVVF